MSKSDTQAQLAAAYGRLLNDTGRRPTVRALKAAARVSTDAAAAFLRDIATQDEVPDAPDLTAPLQALWAAAWHVAADTARAEVAEQVDQLTADLVAATADAEQQLQAADTAQTAQHAAEEIAATATRRADELERRVAALDEELAGLRLQIADLQAAERAATTRADRAEAAVDTLQGVLATLKPVKAV
ncbi:hypothetical protein GZ998_08970 [Actinomyces sp. 594]|uniref:hypothetical protein n=1 Tax=Actinomyces sp. 594 TaxID=2057793 RepID=UPI001C577691|nr:hypothetical protein [Actinomyces sp. 594]MBW3069631.1 hypothetical protein [Actinomyces sp. 594]